jgi:hypothetical protein
MVLPSFEGAASNYSQGLLSTRRIIGIKVFILKAL